MPILFSFVMLTAMILCMSVTNRFYYSKIKGRFAVDEIPIGFNLLRASSFIAWGLLISKIPGVFFEVTEILKMSTTGMDLLMMQGIYFSVFLSICIASFVIIAWIASILHSVFLKGSSMIEAAVLNRTSGSILFLGIQLGMSLVTAELLPYLFNMFVSRPNVPMFN